MSYKSLIKTFRTHNYVETLATSTEYLVNVWTTHCNSRSEWSKKVKIWQLNIGNAKLLMNYYLDSNCC